VLLLFAPFENSKWPPAEVKFALKPYGKQHFHLLLEENISAKFGFELYKRMSVHFRRSCQCDRTKNNNKMAKLSN
jgi:hypothetical protein